MFIVMMLIYLVGKFLERKKREFDLARLGKIEKMPINPKTDGRASSNHSDAWTDNKTAAEVIVRHCGSGIILDNGYFCIDINDSSDVIGDFKLGGLDHIMSEFVYS